MCGIVGYIGSEKNTVSFLLEGLKKLEYRGYDSAGIAVFDKNDFTVIKKKGRVKNIVEIASKQKFCSKVGISHTRWATHGTVTDENSHPHLSSDGVFALVHNGVIENYSNMKNFLLTKGYTFCSETDSEALVNLLAYHYEKEKVLLKTNESNAEEKSPQEVFLEALKKTLKHVEGTYGLAVMCKDCPDFLVGARKGSPLILGVGKNEKFLASDVSAFVGKTQNVVYLEDGQIVCINSDDFSILSTSDDNKDCTICPVISKVDWEIDQADKGKYSTFMEKEIFEQPHCLENAIRGRLFKEEATARLDGLNITAAEIRQVERIVFCACGTAWHACQVAEYLIEKYARIPVEVEYASEFRYRNAPLDKNTLFFVVSQSGETIDTLQALREAKRKGYKVLAITNVVGSSIAMESDGGIFQHAGQEVGVASTKAFTSQIAISIMLALYFGRLRDMSFSMGKEIIEAIENLPSLVQEILNQEAHIKKIASLYYEKPDFLFLGRLQMFPIALEGALKLKEISYIHAEGYPAAEMKHGPIALVCDECPALFFAFKDEMYNKVISNIQEIKARNADVIVITDAGDDFPKDLATHLIQVPRAHECLRTILASIPTQIFAHEIAKLRGKDVDKPRNLAKSVTVE